MSTEIYRNIIYGHMNTHIFFLEHSKNAGVTASFFFISAKDTKKTLLIWVTQISVIHHSNMLGVYTTKVCAFAK